MVQMPHNNHSTNYCRAIVALAMARPPIHSLVAFTLFQRAFCCAECFPGTTLASLYEFKLLSQRQKDHNITIGIIS